MAEIDLDDEFLTTEQVAKLLKTTKAGVNNLCHRRKLSFVKFTKKRLFHKATLMHDVMKNSVKQI